jgi:hypothetical protein
MPEENYLTLKCGSLKACDFRGNAPAVALLRKYNAIEHKQLGDPTPEEKELVCAMIDLMPGAVEVHVHEQDKSMSKEAAKKYVMLYDGDDG